MATFLDLSLRPEPKDDAFYINLNACTDEEFFRLVAKRLDAHWEPVATSLGILNDKIVSIKKENPDPDEQIFQMLMTVNGNMKGMGNVRDAIQKALWDNGRRDLAAEISSGKWKKPAEPVVDTTDSGKPYGYPTMDEKKLSKLAGRLPGDMEQLATELGVPSEQVDKLKDKHRKVKEQTFQMLLKWQKNEPAANHQQLLITALKTIGRRDVALDLETDAL